MDGEGPGAEYLASLRECDTTVQEWAKKKIGLIQVVRPVISKKMYICLKNH
jgi:hypothetical protein